MNRPGRPKREWWNGRRAARWVAAAAGFFLLPKCIACALVYLALAGRAGWELCGTAAAPAYPLISVLPLVGLTLGAFFLGCALRRRRCRQARGLG